MHQHTPLPPVSQPIALFSEFVSDTPKTIILKEKILSFSGDSFEIKLDNHEPILKVKGSWAPFHGRKKVEDMDGQHLFDITKEHMHLHTTYVIEDPEGEKIVEIRSDFKFIGSKANITFHDRNGKPVTLGMSGKIFEHNADIVDQETGQVAAHIRHQRFNGRKMMFGQDTYTVTVAPGVDMALIAALCICFDEKNHD
ncbi:hypothetical protein N7456_005935 [Penicillium angulare]|uniref:Tubby C-terminal-like domain-containing protein n=1 Tax=Penicillium angulare TaxID=116970 RepID=A0A9W9KK34_9EURO|nr:hypothetical protein N7456_005935 [Penicillium angulare]